jgi:hypothetical protein
MDQTRLFPVPYSYPVTQKAQTAAMMQINTSQ